MILRTGPRLPIGSVLVALFAVLLLSSASRAQTSVATSASQTAPANSGQPSSARSAAASDATSANASSSTRAAQSHATPALTLEQQIARLPPLTGVNVDVKAQGQAILQHLSEVLRFYRAATSKIQKAGEPTDILYAEQTKAQATQIAQLAFESARNEAALLAHLSGAPNSTSQTPDAAGTPQETQRLAAARARILSQIAALQAVDAANDQAIAHSNAKTRPPLLQKQEQIDGEFKLLQATLDALSRVAKFTDTQGEHAGLVGEVDRLSNSAPELNTATGKSIASAPLENLAETQHSGLVTQASVLFDLLSAQRSIDQLAAETDRLHAQANALREPFLNVLSSLFKQGQALSQQTLDLNATPTTNQQDILATRKQFDQLTSTFRVLSDTMLPLSQEVMLLDQQRGTLTSWRNAVHEEYKAILQSILIRVSFIALALLVLAVVGQLWNRATVRYVADLRRRRQLLVVRRVVIGFLGGLIVIFGFITQFSSLATFAGFISAGIAVGLQTILLSVAAYFFIIGRYGVRVGDRITVAGVTGTVIEVGIARFYMMELVGSGTELHSTGRVAVFANSVLFQTGTPLYKQLPGTEYAWHELTAKLKPEADTEAVSNELCNIINNVYQTYRPAIDAQQRQIESWIGAAVDPPRVDSYLRVVDDSPQIAILFPVQIGAAAQTDAAIASQILKAMQAGGALQQGVAGVPAIKAAIKT